MLPDHLRKLVPLAMLTGTGPLALNAWLPLLPDVQRTFGVTLSEVQATVSFALVAYALGMLVTGPLVDRIGHRRAVLFGLFGYLLGNLLCLFTQQMGWLIAGRVLITAGAAITFITSRSICAEIFPPEGLRRAVAQLMMIGLVVPVFAPMIGSALGLVWGWRSVFVFLFAYGLCALLMAWHKIRLPKTHAAHQQQVEPMTRRAALLRQTYLIPISMFVLYYLPYIVFISLAPHLLENYYGRPASMYAQLFPILIVAYFIGNFVVTRVGHQKGGAWLIRHSLMIVVIGFVFAYVLQALHWQHPLALFLPYATLGIAHGLAMPTLSTYAIEASRPHTALGWGLLGFSQQVLGGICVQLMSMSDVNSPYPVLLFGTGATVLFALLYWRGWKRKA
jgi:MFS transporter, DHA1 family, multidrug resistance protein